MLLAAARRRLWPGPSGAMAVSVVRRLLAGGCGPRGGRVGPTAAAQLGLPVGPPRAGPSASPPSRCDGPPRALRLRPVGGCGPLLARGGCGPPRGIHGSDCGGGGPVGYGDPRPAQPILSRSGGCGPGPAGGGGGVAVPGGSGHGRARRAGDLAPPAAAAKAAPPVLPGEAAAPPEPATAQVPLGASASGSRPDPRRAAGGGDAAAAAASLLAAGAAAAAAGGQEEEETSGEEEEKGRGRGRDPGTGLTTLENAGRVRRRALRAIRLGGPLDPAAPPPGVGLSAWAAALGAVATFAPAGPPRAAARERARSSGLGAYRGAAAPSGRPRSQAPRGQAAAPAGPPAATGRMNNAVLIAGGGPPGCSGTPRAPPRRPPGRPPPGGRPLGPLDGAGGPTGGGCGGCGPAGRRGGCGPAAPGPGRLGHPPGGGWHPGGPQRPDAGPGVGVGGPRRVCGLRPAYLGPHHARRGRPGRPPRAVPAARGDVEAAVAGDLDFVAAAHYYLGHRGLWPAVFQELQPFPFPNTGDLQDFLERVGWSPTRWGDRAAAHLGNWMLEALLAAAARHFGMEVEADGWAAAPYERLLSRMPAGMRGDGSEDPRTFWGVLATAAIYLDEARAVASLVDHLLICMAGPHFLYMWRWAGAPPPEAPPVPAPPRAVPAAAAPAPAAWDAAPGVTLTAAPGSWARRGRRGALGGVGAALTDGGCGPDRVAARPGGGCSPGRTAGSQRLRPPGRTEGSGCGHRGCGPRAPPCSEGRGGGERARLGRPGSGPRERLFVRARRPAGGGRLAWFVFAAAGAVPPLAGGGCCCCFFCAFACCCGGAAGVRGGWGAWGPPPSCQDGGDGVAAPDGRPRLPARALAAPGLRPGTADAGGRAGPPRGGCGPPR